MAKRGFVSWLLGRWPTALAAGPLLLTFGSGYPGGGELALALASMQVPYLFLGEARGHFARPGLLKRQLAGLVAFGAVSLFAITASPETGRYVIAAGWLGHGLWDIVHHRADAVVPRQYAEWCAVIDLVGVAIILAA